MAIPLLFPATYFLTMNDKAAYAVFYIAAIVCVIFDQKEMVKAGDEPEPQFVGSALGILIFPSLYVYGRAKAAGANTHLPDGISLHQVNELINQGL